MSSGLSDHDVAAQVPVAAGVPVAAPAAANWMDAVENRINTVIDKQEAMLETLNSKKRTIERLQAEVKRHRVDWHVLEMEYNCLNAMSSHDRQQAFKDMIDNTDGIDYDDPAPGEIELEDERSQRELVEQQRVLVEQRDEAERRSARRSVGLE